VSNRRIGQHARNPERFLEVTRSYNAKCIGQGEHMANLSRYSLLVQRLRQVNRELMANKNCAEHYKECGIIFREAQRMGWRDNARTPPDEVQSVLPRDVVE
jgi:hypothetical protein